MKTQDERLKEALSQLADAQNKLAMIENSVSRLHAVAAMSNMMPTSVVMKVTSPILDMIGADE